MILNDDNDHDLMVIAYGLLKISHNKDFILKYFIM